MFTRALSFAILMWSSLLVQAISPALIPIRVGDRFGYCDAELRMLIPAQFENAEPFGAYGAIVQLHGKFGIIDAQGKWQVPAVLDEIQVGEAMRLRKGTQYALADMTGCLLSDFCYDAVYVLKNGFFMTDQHGLKGLLNAAGQVVVPNRYEHVSQLRDNQGHYVDLFSVRDEGQLGVYNTCGERMQFPRFGRIDVFQEGFAVVQDDGKFGLIDLEGQLRVPCQYEQLQPMNEGLCAAKLKNRWGFIDATGREMVPFNFEAVQESGFFQGRAAVNKAGTWLFVRRDGEVEFPLDHGYQSLGSLSEGMVAACKLMEDGSIKYGYVDPDGKTKIAFRYERAEMFRRGYAIVGDRVAKEQSMIKEMRYGVIDRLGHSIIPIGLHAQSEARLKRDSLAYLGFATLIANGRTCLIDGRGRRFGCSGSALDALQKEWMGTRCEGQEMIAVSKNGLWGFCNARGTLVIPCIYSSVECFDGGLARVWPSTDNGKLSYFIDTSGRAYYRAATGG